MLPPGLVAQPADRTDDRHYRELHPSARTVARLLVGACSCDLVRARHTDALEDERHHRDRHRRAGGSREELIALLDRHRRGAGVAPPRGGWPHGLAAFVAEHARNAGETLYALRFSAPAAPGPHGTVRRMRAAEVQARPNGWLVEGSPVIVAR
jgi:hypothetical protein